jgi:hypothetical protein
MRPLAAVAVLAALAALAACKDDPGPSCAQVTDHMLEVTKQMLAGHDGMGQLGDRKAMIAQCEQRNLTKQVRQCLMTAKDLDGFAACRKSAVPPRVIDRPAPTGSDRGTPPP